MKQFMKKHDIWLRLLSLLLALVLWVLARDAVNPIKTNVISNVPLTVIGADTLLGNTGLSVIESTESVNITVRGPNAEITNASLRRRIAATVDVSGITDGAGEYTLPVRVTVGVNDVEAGSVSARVLIDKVVTETVPVRVETTGIPADGYRADTPEPATTKEITVSGPASELREVAYAYGTIPVDGCSATFTGECTITLYNDAGNPITGTHVTSQTDTINVRVPVYPVESVKLAVSLTDGDTLKTDQVDVSIDPDTVRLLGDQNILAGLPEINLGAIDLDNVRTGVPIEMEIPLPEGVRLDAGQSATARVTISVKEEESVSTRKVEVTRFMPTDTAHVQTPYTVSVLTDSVEVELRGSESALEQVDLNTLTIGLTFDSVSLGVGTHKVKGLVAATGLPAGVTLVQEDVEVEIQITEDDAPPAESGVAE
ncbi:YbbR-like domain-containing protein [Agathobaculum desmolans]|uniref:CdaR family protein n=1 Tax=Agathobaculum desmolans TaxID=39484 RepID=UPI0004E0E373|nr:CdaR family protein [Agathobaculum desmolans]